MLDPKAELDVLRAYWVNRRVFVKGPNQIAIIVGVYRTTDFWVARGESVWFDAVYEKHIDIHQDLQNCPSMRREENRDIPVGFYRFQLAYKDIVEELPDV